jgi:hypothetical protein
MKDYWEASEPESQPEPMPKWMIAFIAIASVMVALACGDYGYTQTTDKINILKYSTPEEFLR